MSDPLPISEVPDDDVALRAIVEGVEAEMGEQFYTSLVRHLAGALDVAYAFVSEFTPDRAHFRMVALWARGAPGPRLTVPIAGTPCEAVLGGEMSHHPSELQQRFPADVALAEWDAQSYCGVPLLDATGAVVGHLAIIDDEPMLDGPRGLAIMRIFAARVSAELERQRVESALRDSEERYRDLYEKAPVTYMSFGVDGRLLGWNQRAVEMTGYPPDELAGMLFLDLVADTPHGKPHAAALNEQFLAGIETSSELEGRRKDGSTFWVRASVRPLRDAQGRVAATQSILVDITDRKRAEEALRVSEERMARVLDSAMDAIVIIDETSTIELFNDAAERAFQCAAPDAIGCSFDRFLTAGFRTALDAAMRALGEGGATAPYVWAPDGLKARDTSGREFAIEATISHVEVHGRRLFTLILRDVELRRRAAEELRLLHRQNEYLQEEIRAVHNVEEIVGQSRTLHGVLEQVRLVAPTASTVLIVGETGTGKELIARAVHSGSDRASRPLVKVNCAALPTGLIESELFGHEKGAFTGAVERRIGRFELADRGTIFLDEIGEMPLDVQAKLLRVLQEQELERIGGSRPIKVDVRVIAATNRNLARMVAGGTFRQDLYYRLHVFPLALPPLRERAEDIPTLVHYFVARYATKIGRRITHIARETVQRLVAYPWPGNVRELENVIERAVILSSGLELTVGAELVPAPASLSLPTAPTLAAAPAFPSADEAMQSASLDAVERGHILSMLKRTRWRIEGPTGAAKLLDMHPSTLRSRMKKLGIRRRPAASS